MRDDWPFLSPRSAPVITTERVACGTRPVLLVTHDLEDGAWQFLDGGEVDVAEGIRIPLSHIAVRDPSVFQLADLPRGWLAWRSTPGEPWTRLPRRSRRTTQASVA